MENLPAKLAAALVRAQSKAKAVPKDASNAHHGYRYASAESIVDEGRLTLSEQGLALLCTTAVLLEHVVGAGVSVPILRATYMLVHEAGDQISWTRDWPVIEGKGRPLDKATGGALTTALAYAIRDALMLPRDDELAAMDRRDDRDHGTQEQPRAEQPRPAAQEASRPAAAPSPDRAVELELAINAAGEAGSDLRPLVAEIERIGVNDEAKASLKYLARAWECRDLDAFAALGAAIRREQSKTWADISLARIRPAYTALNSNRRRPEAA